LRRKLRLRFSKEFNFITKCWFLRSQPNPKYTKPGTRESNARLTVDQSENVRVSANKL